MIMMGGGENPKEYIGKTKIKTPSMIWKADCFPVSTRTKNNPDYPYMGNGSKLNGTKETPTRVRQGIGSMINSYVGPRSSEKK